MTLTIILVAFLCLLKLDQYTSQHEIVNSNQLSLHENISGCLKFNLPTLLEIV